MNVLLRCFLGAIAATASCWAQGDPDPFSSGEPEEKIPMEVLKKVARESNVDLVIEVFSVPMVTSASWRREFPKDVDFYEKLLAGIETKEVVLEEHLSGTTKGSGEMVLQDVSEYQYATEFWLAQGVRNPENLKQWEEAYVPAWPSSFDTTFLGTWVEVKAGINPQCDLVGLEISVS